MRRTLRSPPLFLINLHSQLVLEKMESLGQLDEQYEDENSRWHGEV
jgi:hypothetical protein